MRSARRLRLHPAFALVSDRAIRHTEELRELHVPLVLLEKQTEALQAGVGECSVADVGIILAAELGLVELPETVQFLLRRAQSIAQELERNTLLVALIGNRLQCGFPGFC